jgi:transposase InsO family protein
MRDFLVLFVHLIVTVARLARPGGLRSVVAESALVRHQLLVINRGRKRAPNLRAADRIIAGLCTLFMRRVRVLRSAIVLKPSTLLHLQSVMRKRKYRMLFSPGRRRRPGPKGPTKDLIDAVVAMKRRNPNWGCPRIAQQIALAFGVAIDKDIVRRLLSVHYRPDSDSGGPSWLTFLGHVKDSLWSCDLFRCESATLRTYWVLVVMDQFTRRLIGFGVHGGIVDGLALCRMFHRAIRGHRLPRYLSSDHDPLYRFHQWQANLRVLEVTEIKTVPYVPLSHRHIHDLHLRDREPAFTPAPIVLLDIKLDNDEGPRPEIGLIDFELSNELRNLMGRIDRIEKERVVRIEVRGGIPRRIIFQCSVTEVLP